MATTPTLVPPPSDDPAVPFWIRPDLIITNGRDPLGLDAISTYRIMPLLFPGILELSRRARYFSFFAYLVATFAERYPTADMDAFDRFVAQSEYEYGYAALTCPRCTNEPRGRIGVLGEIALRPARRDRPTLLTRERSVETQYGGYGLFYRRPMEYLGVLAAAGTTLDDGRVLTTDRLANSYARSLARHFEDAVSGTRWAMHDLGGDDPVPAEDLFELGEAACLCRLSEAPAEREAILSLFTQPVPNATTAIEADAQLRQRAFAHFLVAIDREPLAAASYREWRRALWEMALELPEAKPDAQSQTSASWGAFAAREIQSAAIGVLFYAACRLGRSEPGSFTHRSFLAKVRDALASEATACSVLTPGLDGKTSALATALATELGGVPLEQLLVTAVEHHGALDAVAVLLELRRRLPKASAMPSAWDEVGRIDGDHQDGLLSFVRQLDLHLAGEPTIAQTVTWLVERYVLKPHERVAMSKLPRHTFRFRYDGSELIFYSKPTIDLGDGLLRHEPLSLLTHDLDLWTQTADGAQVTPLGHDVAAKAFGR